MRCRKKERNNFSPPHIFVVCVPYLGLEKLGSEIRPGGWVIVSPVWHVITRVISLHPCVILSPV